MRKLVTIRKIEKIEPIKGADRIEKITVGAWEVVSQKGQHHVGNEILYFEIDSLLPIAEPFIDSFEKYGRKKAQLDDGSIIEGYRLKSIKLREVVSQGFILPLSLFPLIDFSNKTKDYAEVLGVHKYEKPETAQDIEANKIIIPKSQFGKYKYYLRAFLEAKFPKFFKRLKFKTSFPDFLKRTDQERIQNLKAQVWDAFTRNIKFQVSVKLDGSSISIFRNKKDKGVCSRNLRKNPKQKTDAFVVQAESIHKLLAKTKGNYVFQGEMCGPKIQQNFEGILKNQVYVYSMFDIETQKYADPYIVDAACKQLGIPHVPVVGYYTLKELFPTAQDADDLVKQMLKYADGPSGLNGKYREGLVYKSMDGQFSFKTISNTYLLKRDKELEVLEAQEDAVTQPTE